MQLLSSIVGRRKIRSAGKRSGSVEITLPSVFAALEGVACDIAIRAEEGAPVIELRPQGSPLSDLIRQCWEALQGGVYKEERRPLPERQFVVTFAELEDEVCDQVVFNASDLRSLSSKDERSIRSLAGFIESLVTLDQISLSREPARAKMSGKIIACLLTGDSLDLDFYAIDSMQAMARKAAFDERFQASCLKNSARWAEVSSAYKAITAIVGSGAFDAQSKPRRAFDLAMRFEKSLSLSGYSQLSD